MRISGFEKNSVVDYPGKLAAVFFTPGCNMDCFYCHNRSLLAPGAKDSVLDNQAIFEFLKSRRLIIDAVVITGGEPTLQIDLPKFAKRVKSLGFLVKLDTNGTKPWIIRNLIENNLVDFIAMDIKAPIDKYKQVANRDIDITAINESIDLIIGSGVEHEFRTTFAPTLNKLDILKIAARVRNSQSYILQQYRQPGVGFDMFGPTVQQPPHAEQFVFETAKLAAQIGTNCTARGLTMNEEFYESKFNFVLHENDMIHFRNQLSKAGYQSVSIEPQIQNYKYNQDSLL